MRTLMQSLALMTLVAFTTAFAGKVTIATKGEAVVPTGNVVFASTYQQWIDPANNFVKYIDQYDQARVVFIGSEAYSVDGDGKVPTVSEGMGYGLLLSYANDDQLLFDKFLRYVIATANNYGCGLFDARQRCCLATSPFLMPWLVNEQGKPFWYQSSPSLSNRALADAEATYTSGSASDADFQIAWAVHLAAEKVKANSWQNSSFTTSSGTFNYAELFEAIGKAIRLSDVDLDTLRYAPGNQWGTAGTAFCYPGYFTPQAFDALAQLPPLDVSSECPVNPPVQTPANSLLLIYKNNVTKTVSIDYMGGAGTIAPDQNFVPKPDSSTGFTVEAIATASATSTSSNQYYNNLTFQATFYGELGQALYVANYFFEYNTFNGVLKWVVTDRGSSPEAKVCLINNVAHVFLTEPDIEKVNFGWAAVKTNTLLTVQTFQETYHTGLFPNTLFYGGEYPYNPWNRSFAYDAVRFPLWAASYAYTTNPKDSTSALQRSMLSALVGPKGVAPFIQPVPLGKSMPTEGIEVFTDQPVGNYSTAAPSLNGPIAMTALLSGNQALYDSLIGPLTSYQITQRQPQPSDPAGDSGPYFDAAILLLVEALINQKM